MTDMSTTPETDALLLELNEGRVYETYGPMVEHARSLEARLIAQTELLREARSFVAASDDGDRWYLLSRIDAALSAHATCKHPWTGDGPIPAKWKCACGTVVYRSYEDYCWD